MAKRSTIRGAKSPVKANKRTGRRSQSKSPPKTEVEREPEAEPNTESETENGELGLPDGSQGASASFVYGAFANWLGNKFATSKLSFFIGLAAAFALWVAVLPISYWSFLIATPGLWAWADDSWLRAIAALFGSFFLIYPPLFALFGAYQLSDLLAGASLASDSIEASQERLAKAENEAIETRDEAELLPLLRYSRAQLEAYYDMSREQTRRSFLNAVIAMWLGFVILLFGIGLYIAPLERFGIVNPSSDANIIVLASAVIVEFISTLFLWVYRSTVGQLTYYYRLQMQSHTAVLCFRMAYGMRQVDPARMQIIKHLLNSALVPERPRMSNGERLFSFLKSPGTEKPD